MATTKAQRALGTFTRARNTADGALVRTQTAAHAMLTRPRTGAATAEYVVVLVAGVAFAAVLLAIVKSDAVKRQLTEIVNNCLKAAALK